jgi:hypothetical protein
MSADKPNPPSPGGERPLEEKAAQRVAANAAQHGGEKATEERVVEHYPPPEPDELPPPTFKQALIGYGSILLALVVLGLVIGLLMKVLR